MAEKKYIYATAANGLEVRIPADRYPQWKAEQDKIKAGQSKEDRQMQDRLRSVMADK
jgi:hypothetical protein